MTSEHKNQLRTAYADTDYWVDVPGGRFLIRVGEFQPALSQLLAVENASDWAFVTACNPYSQQLPDADNSIRMCHLVADLSIAGYRFFSGEGASRSGDWSPEPSLLIIGIGQEYAIQIARRYGQLAIVCGRDSQPARLVWTDLDTTTSDRIN